MDHYVYLHRKKTTGEVFYIGKGSGGRAWGQDMRSSTWRTTVANHGYLVEIVETNLQEWYAFELEKLLINYYGLIRDGTGTLVNKVRGVPDGFTSPTKLVSQKKFHLYNMYTECEFIGTRQEFKEKFGFKANHIFKDKRVVTHEKGWCIYSDRGAAKRVIKHHFVSKDGEEFIGTRDAFNKKYSLNCAPLFKKSPAKYVCGWTLFEYKDFAFVDGSNRTIYKFIHKSGEIFNGTVGAFQHHFKINIRPLFGKGKSKTQKGWRVEDLPCNSQEDMI